ncbi:DgyrCDS13123 [Dimorphilus gyrociliatus]|uniref:acylglycerol lipase n=1 Tax=Dimorphilus gyrociliatus TaxID=2664684 RepID=A0A7I8W9T1_9ANNE|nr:DgyrCDS13123 [Dimorphilus gyrociliatus]
MTRRIDDFLNCIHNNKPVHLIGVSLGGTLTALFANQYSEKIKLITLICPGMRTPIETNFQKQVFDDKRCLFIAESVQDIKEIVKITLYKSYNKVISDTVAYALLQDQKRYKPFLRELFESVVKEEQDIRMQNVFNSLRQPVSIIWGEEDELFHVSGALQLRDLLTDCRRVDIIGEAGHSLAIDDPKQVAQAIQSFRSEFVINSQIL